MATHSLNYKSAPKFDIESEKHLFKEWWTMWQGFEILSGINDIEEKHRREIIRLHAFNNAVSKETLHLINNLPINGEDKNKLDMIIRALRKYNEGSVNEIYERTGSEERSLPARLLASAMGYHVFAIGALLKSLHTAAAPAEPNTAEPDEQVNTSN